MKEAPFLGDGFSIDDLEYVLETLENRKQKFPDEDFSMSLGVVLFNCGDRFTPVHCINGEWTGRKKDIPLREDGGIPLCPNGHVMTEGIGIKLGWVIDIV